MRRPLLRQQGIKKLGRPKVGKKVEEAIREHLAAGCGILSLDFSNASSFCSWRAAAGG
jgi:hypothetical protein